MHRLYFIDVGVPIPRAYRFLHVSRFNFEMTTLTLLKTCLEMLLR